MQKFTTELSLPDDHYIKIGRIMAHWSAMEWAAGRAIAEILDLNAKEGRAFTAEMKGCEVLRVLRLVAILRLTDSRRTESLLKLIKKLEDLVPDRNLIAHGNWGRDNSGKLHLVKYKGGKRHIGRITGRAIPMGSTELASLERRLTNPCHEVITWTDEMIAARKSSL